MKMIRAALPFLVFAIPAAAQAPWKELGNSLTNGGLSNLSTSCLNPTLALNPLTRLPGAVYTKNQSAVLFREWTGTDWVERGASGTTGVSTGEIATPTLAYDPEGRPVVAWSKWDYNLGAAVIMLKGWNGTAWAAYGDSDKAVGISGLSYDLNYTPSLAIAPSGQMCIAWDANGTSVHVKRYDPERDLWLPMGGGMAQSPSASAGASTYTSEPSLAIGGDGRMAVTWTDRTVLPRQIFARQWDDVAKQWVGMNGSDYGGGVSKTPSSWNASSPRCVVDAAGRVGVAWQARADADGSHAILFRRFDPATQAWEDVGGSGSGNGIAPLPAGYAGQPAPTLAFDGVDSPVVAWRQEKVGDKEVVYLKHWNPGKKAWEELAGSTTELGIYASANPDCIHPSLVIDPVRNDFYIAWQDNWKPATGGPFQGIYAACYQNSAPAVATLEQYLLKSPTVIPPGGLTMGETGFSISAGIGDAEGDGFTLEVEVTSVDGTSKQTVTTMSPSISGTIVLDVEDLLTLGTRYSWRIRATDTYKLKSAWFDFDSADPAVTDVYARDNADPLGQPLVLLGADGAALALGEGVPSLDTLVIKGPVSDDDDDAVKVEVERRFLGEDFHDLATMASAFVAAGAEAAIDTMADDGSFHLQYRFVDIYGGASAWTSFGGNPETEADYVGIPHGSLGGGVCGESAAGSETGWIVLLAIGLASAARKS